MAERIPQHRLMESGSRKVMDSYFTNGKSPMDVTRSIRSLSLYQITDLTTHLIMGQVEDGWLPPGGERHDARALLSQINFKEFNLPAARRRVTGAFTEAARRVGEDTDDNTLEAVEKTGSILVGSLPQDKLTDEDKQFAKALYGIVRQVDKRTGVAQDDLVDKTNLKSARERIRTIQRLSELGFAPNAIMAATDFDTHTINSGIRTLKHSGAWPEKVRTLEDVPSFWTHEREQIEPGVSEPILYIESNFTNLEPFQLHLRHFRDQLGMNTREFAKHFGFDEDQYGNIERGLHKRPEQDTLIKIKTAVDKKVLEGNPTAIAIDKITTMLLQSKRGRDTENTLQRIREEVPFHGIVVFTSDGEILDLRPDTTNVASLLDAVHYSIRLPYTIHYGERTYTERAANGETDTLPFDSEIYSDLVPAGK